MFHQNFNQKVLADFKILFGWLDDRPQTKGTSGALRDFLVSVLEAKDREAHLELQRRLPVPPAGFGDIWVSLKELRALFEQPEQLSSSVDYGEDVLDTRKP